MSAHQTVFDDRRKQPPTPHMSMTDMVDELPPTLLLERLSIPVLGLSDDGVVEFANASFAALLGQTRGHLASMSPNEIFRGIPAEQSAVSFVRANSERVVELRHANGGLVHAIISESILRRDNEEAALVTFTDVSEQARPAGVSLLTLVG